MRLLFDDRLAPMTSELGFIELQLDQAVEGFVRWQTVIQEKRGVTLSTRRLDVDLEQQLLLLPPLTSVEARRFLFVATDSPWVAYFDNGRRGPDPSGPMAYLARTLGCRALRVALIPHREPTQRDGRWIGRYGATILDLYGPVVTNHMNIVRTISVVNDGGKWQFEQAGEPLPFEDTSHYAARRVRERFPAELLAHYLGALGLTPFQESFYRHEGVFVEKRGPVATGLQEFSLEDVRAAL